MDKPQNLQFFLYYLAIMRRYLHTDRQAPVRHLLWKGSANRIVTQIEGSYHGQWRKFSITFSLNSVSRRHSWFGHRISRFIMKWLVIFSRQKEPVFRFEKIHVVVSLLKACPSGLWDHLQKLSIYCIEVNKLVFRRLQRWMTWAVDLMQSL